MVPCYMPLMNIQEIQQLYKHISTVRFVIAQNSKTFLSIDCAVMGLGNSSCGPGVLKKYTVPTTTQTLRIRILPIE